MLISKDDFQQFWNFETMKSISNFLEKVDRQNQKFKNQTND